MVTKAIPRVRLILASGCLVFGLFPTAHSDASPGSSRDDLAVATFAGGCFWCLQRPFDELEGVASTTVGYTGGHTENPTYAEVSAGGTGHVETVRVVYDPAQISYPRLLQVFWHHINPLTTNRQFCDTGEKYNTGIFFHTERQRRIAEASKQALEASGRFERPIVTEIAPASAFYPADDYHQKFYLTHPFWYGLVCYGCSRDQRLRELWGRKEGPRSFVVGKFWFGG